ncbi:MAG: GNAT family N-acetyltransferase [Actinomycetes bacterium]
MDASGAVLGRVNLADVADGEASLGYRVAEHAAAGGVATSAVRETLGVAAALGLRRVTAMTTVTNVASQTVLTRNGFVPCAGEPAELDGQPAVHYERLAP